MGENEVMMAKCAQMEVLQNRLSRHFNKLWQIPFSYAGIIALTVSKGPDDLHWAIFGVLAIAGIFVNWSMIGAKRAYSRTIKNLFDLEIAMDLKPTTRCFPSHYMPFFAIAWIAVFSALTIAIYQLYQIT